MTEWKRWRHCHIYYVNGKKMGLVSAFRNEWGGSCFNAYVRGVLVKPYPHEMAYFDTKHNAWGSLRKAKYLVELECRELVSNNERK